MSRAVSKGHEFWRSALERQRASGLSVAAFCRQESLSDKTFYLWRRRFHVEECDQPVDRGFTELMIDHEVASGPRVEVTLESSVRLVVSNVASDDQLVQILAALRATA